MVKLSIIIRCYNEEQHIGRLLSGILLQSISNIEIVIVDSGSTDATISIASRFPIKLISIKPENFSFGRALNLGCQVATGEFIVIASAHVYPVYRDWLEQLIKPFQDSSVALAYGQQRGNDVTKYSERQVFQKWFPDRSNLHQSHPFCNNANCAIRRAVWEKNYYDETLTGLEDIDFAKKIQNQGYRIAYIADAEIIHVHNESYTKIYNRYRREAIAFKKIYPQEHFNLWDFARLWIGNTISDSYHAWHDRVLLENLVGIIVFRLMQFWGTYRGFSMHGSVSSELKQTFYYPNNLERPKRANQELPYGSESEKNILRQIEYSKVTRER